MNDAASAPASIKIQRRIEWIDTDAAGIYHWTAVCRMAEAAEAELHRALGITELTFGVSPRVSVQFDFARSLRFDDLVSIELTVDRVGTSSISYRLTVNGPEGKAASGRMVTCIVDPVQGRPVAVPDRLREALTQSGRQESA